MEALGVPAAGDRDELDRDLRDELDDAGFLSSCVGNPSGRGDLGAGQSHAAARGVRTWGDPYLVDDTFVDVSAEDIPADLRPGRHPRHGCIFPYNRKIQSALWRLLGGCARGEVRLFSALR